MRGRSHVCFATSNFSYVVGSLQYAMETNVHSEDCKRRNGNLETQVSGHN